MRSLTERCGDSMVSRREMAPECSLAATWSTARLGHLPVHCGFFVPSTPFLPSGQQVRISSCYWRNQVGGSKTLRNSTAAAKLKTAGIFITKRYANKEGTKLKKGKEVLKSDFFFWVGGTTLLKIPDFTKYKIVLVYYYLKYIINTI